MDNNYIRRMPVGQRTTRRHGSGFPFPLFAFFLRQHRMQKEYGTMLFSPAYHLRLQHPVPDLILFPFPLIQIPLTARSAGIILLVSAQYGIRTPERKYVLSVSGGTGRIHGKTGIPETNVLLPAGFRKKPLPLGGMRGTCFCSCRALPQLPYASMERTI